MGYLVSPYTCHYNLPTTRYGCVASGDFCRLLITFPNSWDVGPDLDSNRLTFDSVPERPLCCVDMVSMTSSSRYQSRLEIHSRSGSTELVYMCS